MPFTPTSSIRHGELTRANRPRRIPSAKTISNLELAKHRPHFSLAVAEPRWKLPKTRKQAQVGWAACSAMFISGCPLPCSWLDCCSLASCARDRIRNHDLRSATFRLIGNAKRLAFQKTSAPRHPFRLHGRRLAWRRRSAHKARVHWDFSDGHFADHGHRCFSRALESSCVDPWHFVGSRGRSPRTSLDHLGRSRRLPLGCG